MLVFSIKDLKSSNYGQPFYQLTKGLAERAFIDLANDPKSTVNAHPEDFQLWCIGSWDDQTGAFENNNHEYMGLAADLLQAVSPAPKQVA